MSCENKTESGKVFVKGKAAGKYTCDKVAIKTTFYCANSSAAKATETMMSQCEKFLQCLAEYGVDISTIQLQKDNLDQPGYRNEDKSKASRTLKFDCDATATINNLILRIIQIEHLDAEISTDYYLSNEDELRKKLRSEAMADSRENAELLAQAANKTIVGVDTIDMCNNPSRVSHVKSITVDDSADDILCLFSKKLSMPTRDIEETVEVTWLLS